MVLTPRIILTAVTRLTPIRKTADSNHESYFCWLHAFPSRRKRDLIAQIRPRNFFRTCFAFIIRLLFSLGGPRIETLWGRGFTHPSRPALRPTRLLQNGYRFSFPGVKRSGCGLNHPTLSTTEVKERVALYLYTHSGPSWPVLRLPLHLLFYLLCNLTLSHKFTQHSRTT
jgi:hypothetical protein